MVEIFGGILLLTEPASEMISTIFNISVLLPPSHTSFLEKKNKTSFPSQVVIFYQIWPRRQVGNTNYLCYLVSFVLILKQDSQRLQNESAIDPLFYLLICSWCDAYLHRNKRCYQQNECAEAKSCKNIIRFEYPN